MEKFSETDLIKLKIRSEEHKERDHSMRERKNLAEKGWRMVAKKFYKSSNGTHFPYGPTEKNIGRKCHHVEWESILGIMHVDHGHVVSIIDDPLGLISPQPQIHPFHVKIYFNEPQYYETIDAKSGNVGIPMVLFDWERGTITGFEKHVVFEGIDPETGEIFYEKREHLYLFKPDKFSYLDGDELNGVSEILYVNLQHFDHADYPNEVDAYIVLGRKKLPKTTSEKLNEIDKRTKKRKRSLDEVSLQPITSRRKF